MRLALVSDIHGNLLALQAVLADAARRGVTQIVNLGDSLSGPLLPRQTAEFLMQQSWPQLAGNHERQLLHFDPAKHYESDRYALSALTPDILQWLSTLPATLRLDDDVLLCHGTPASDLEYFLESIDPRVPLTGVRPASAAEIDQRRGTLPARLIACGHTHVARSVRASDGTLIVNPGSVGLGAYDDDHPSAHRIETASTDARYAIVERHDGHWSAALIGVAYDHEAMAVIAESNGRRDWAFALRTGFSYVEG